MIELLALVQRPLGQAPGQRFRLEQWAPHLESRHGIRLTFRVFESPELSAIIYRPGHLLAKAAWMVRDAYRQRCVLPNARRHDAVVVYREAAPLGPAIYERLLARDSVPLLFDFDDAIWISNASGANGVFARLHFPGKTATICRLSAAVTVGNEYLAEYARRRSTSVFVVPTSIDLLRYAVQPELPSDAPFTIVWSGSLSTLDHVEHARPAIEALGQRRRVILRIIGNAPPARPFENVETVFVPWQEAGEAEAIGKAHVGIMPLPDEPFARGKCGLKGLQCMAVGLPVVMSPVGVNAEIVRHGENGLLATNVEDWVKALECLADSRERRRTLGAAARRTVEASYSAEASAARYAAAVRAVLSQRGSTNGNVRRSTRDG
jgi:glycosyltransferase involved in cell wall biosynthesis